MAGDVKTKVSVEGAAEYKAELQSITRQAKVLASEMKAVTSAFDENTAAEEKNIAKAEVLRRQIDIQSQKVELIAERWKKTAEALGENSDEALDLRNALNLATAQLNKMSNELRDTEHSIDATVEGFDEMEEALLDAEQAAKMLSQGMNQVKFKDGDADIEAVTRSTEDFAASMAKLARTVAASAVFKTIVDGVKQVVNAFAEYEQVSGGVEALFGEEAAAIIEQNAFKAYKTAGVSANKYMEQVTSFSAALLDSVEGDTVKAAFIADQAIRDMSDNANRFGTDLSSIQSAYQGFAKQQFQLLDNLKLGYAGTKEGMEQLLAEAERLTGREFDISNLADIYEAIHVIQESMGVTGTTAEEAEDTIVGSAAAIRAAWSNLLVGIAQDSEDLDVLMADFSQSVGTWLDNILEVVKTMVSALISLLPEFLGFGISVMWQIASGILQAAAYGVAAVGEAIAQIIAELFGYDVDFEGAGKNIVDQIWKAFSDTWDDFALAVKYALADLGLQIEIGTANIEASFNRSKGRFNGRSGTLGSPVSGIPVRGAKGATVNNITVNGYSANDGYKLARDIDRELGRLYE